MIALFMLACLAAAPDVQVTITPDQPLPFAYVDEPLVVEVSSPTEKEAKVHVEIEGSRGSVSAHDLGPVDLSDNGNHWSALESVALPRDRYLARFTITAGGVTWKREQSFCRIDRTQPGFTFPVSAAANGNGKENLALAVSAIPGRSLRFDADAADLEARVNLAREAGLQVVIALPLARMAEPAAEVEHLANQLGDRVARWDIEGYETPATATAVAEALHRSHPRAGIGLVVHDDGTLARLFEAGAGPYASAVILDENAPDPVSLLALRDAAEQAGFEGMTLIALSRGIERGALVKPEQSLVKQVLQNLSAGAESTVTSELVLDGQNFGDGYVNLCGMAHLLMDATYVGELEESPGVRIEAFRSADRWILALWAKAAAQDISLKLAEARELSLSDVRNNPIELPAMNGDTLTLRVGAEPLYLSGKGSTVLTDAARRMALQQVEAIFALKDAKRLPAELVAALRVVQEGRGVDRRGFLALTGMFSALEEARQHGKLPAATAVPASAGLGRLLRNLCVAEHERGEPFLEPLREMLAKCSGYTSKYLTGAPNGDSHSRQDWLLGEVARLMAEAKRLDEAGRSTEADAVAALAEGRARALEHAAPESSD